MTTHERTVRIHALTTTIHEILTDVVRFADWNPAISPLVAGPGPAEAGRVYRTLVRDVVPAQFVYTEISPTTVAHTLSFTGFSEEASWQLTADENTARVTHRFRQSGPVSHLIPAGTSDVVGLRLSRLKDRAERPLRSA